MSGKQNAILFIGLTLILANLILTGQGHAIWSAMFAKGNGATPAPGGKQCPPFYTYDPKDKKCHLTPPTIPNPPFPLT